MTQSSSSSLRIVLAGSVGSSRRTLQRLLHQGANVVGVLGLSPALAKPVSGYCRLDDIAESANIPYVEFRNINHPGVIFAVREWSPDILFVVGLSQLVKRELSSIPPLGCVGFHPTWLPKGRGRGPVAWLTIDGSPGAATFFLMDEGVDSGPILVQEPFFVSEKDYASDVIDKLETAIDAALDRWLPALLSGELRPTPQTHSSASYYGRRTPEDGLIHWEWSAGEIHDLIRAASGPHPGAYTYVGNHKMIVWRAEIETQMPYRGVIGRILYLDDRKGWLVQTGNGLLWLTDVEITPNAAENNTRELRVGMKLGYAPQDEVYLLQHRITDLEKRLFELEQIFSKST